MQTLRQLNELALQRERGELPQCFDRNVVSVRDPQHEPPGRFSKLLHSYDRRVRSRDTVSRKGRLGAFFRRLLTPPSPTNPTIPKARFRLRI